MLSWIVVVLLIVFVVALAASAVLVAALTKWARRHNVVDTPNERSSHRTPTPRGGGIAIVVVTVIGVISIQSHSPVISWPTFVTLVISSMLVAAISLIDDLRGLSAKVRLAVHFCAAAALATAVVAGDAAWVPDVGITALGIACIAIAIVWIAGLTNAYNFMDGIDGIAGMQALVTGLGWCALGVLADVRIAAFGGVLLAGSAAGFLIHNWQPARIFMGDVGSAFTGYFFAALTVIVAADKPRLAAAGALLVWPFVFDTSFTLARRVLQRADVFSAHRSHLYQRLEISGLSHSATAVVYGILALIGAAASIAVATGVDAAAYVIGPAAVALVLMVHWRERRNRTDASRLRRFP